MNALLEKHEAHIEDWAWHMYHATGDRMYWGIYCMFSVD